MAPKRKGRGPSRAASSPTGNNTEDVVNVKARHTKTPDKPHAFQDDSWTDDQEAVLFKGMIRWKPVGVHKHFRMIALSQHLQSHGYTPTIHEHTRIPNIWKKLSSLYNLEALDERENAEENEEPTHQFTLPKDEYGQMMFEKRLAPEGSSSPAQSPRPPSAGSISRAATRRASTIEDTEDARSSPASVRGARGSRIARQTRSTRRSQLHEVCSLQDERRGSKVSLNEDSFDGHNEEGAEAPQDGEDEEQTAQDEPSKVSKMKSPRRRSGRRR